MKEAALDLIDWSLEDISPDADHKIHLKMGIEREGYFMPPTSDEFWDDVDSYYSGVKTGGIKIGKIHALLMKKFTEHMIAKVANDGHTPERIYVEDC